jgi:orotate phosphoribosyltransferase
MDAKDIAGLLLDAKALAFNVKEPYTFASGIKSPVYMDCRLVISDVEKRGRIVDELVKHLRNLEFDVVAATASAGIPWGAWVAERMKKPLVYVRKEAKDHGKGKKVEGAAKAGQKAAVVEDLVSTGGSSIATVDSLREAGLKVENCVSLFTYGMAEAENAFKKAGVKLYSLSNFGIAADVARERGYLTSEEAAEAKRWVNNPKEWRK